jgi:hypothetical protein
MADDTLRISAELVDKFSGTATELQRALKRVRDTESHHSREQGRETDRFQRSIRDTTGLLRDGMAPALAAIGVSTVSLGAAITGFGTAAFTVSGRIRELNQLSSQTGTSMQTLRELEGVFSKLGVSREQADDSIRNFAFLDDQLRQRSGALYQYMIARPLLAPLLADMSKTRTHMESLNTLLEGIKRLPANVAEGFRAELMAAAGLPDVLRQMQGPLDEELAKIRAKLDRWTPEAIKNAKDFQEAWDGSKISFENLGNQIGLLVTGPGAQLADWLSAQINQWRIFNNEVVAKGHFPSEMYSPSAKQSGSAIVDWWRRGRTPQIVERGAPGGGLDSLLRKIEQPSLSSGSTFADRWGALGAEEQKKTTREGTYEGVIQAMRELFGTGNDGAMIGAHTGFGGFRPRGGTGSGAGMIGGPGLGGRGGANFMKGALPGPGELVTVQTAAGPITVNKAAAADMKGFVDDMVAAGAPIGDIGSYNQRKIAGSDKWSQHAYGTALDYAQRSRNVVGKEFGSWASSHQDTLGEILRRRNMISGGDWRNPDFGHFEWGPGQVAASTFSDRQTASGLSAATTSGIALPSGGRMGDMYEVTTPDGRKFTAPLIDRGPAGWTKRGVDISGPLAQQMGYGRDFPTDARFGVRPLTGLNEAAKAAGVGAAAAPVEVSGGAKLSVDFKNMPSGTRTWLETHGIFDEVELNRGRTMQRAAD